MGMGRWTMAMISLLLLLAVDCAVFPFLLWIAWSFRLFLEGAFAFQIQIAYKVHNFHLPFSFAYFLADLPVYSTADLPTKCPTNKVPHQGSAPHQGGSGGSSGGGGGSVGGGSDGCSCAHSTFYCSLVGPSRGSVSPPVTTSPLTPAVCSSMCSVL